MKKKNNGSGANRAVRADKKEKNKENRGGGKERGKEKREGERKKKNGVFHFSLRSTKIEPSVFVGARGKVGPRIEGYA